MFGFIVEKEKKMKREYIINFIFKTSMENNAQNANATISKIDDRRSSMGKKYDRLRNSSSHCDQPVELLIYKNGIKLQLTATIKFIILPST